MALDKKTFTTRTTTAVIFAVLMLAGLLVNTYTFLLLTIIIHFGCWYEFVKLMKKASGSFSVIHFLVGISYISIPLFSFAALSLAPAMPKISLISDLDSIPNMFSNFSPLLPVLTILAIWINDTMAYISGSLIGKTPFSPISPKKTWEGTIGGIVLCIVLMAALGYLLPIGQALALVHWIFLAAIAAITGTVGDLFESKLKRDAGVKDSGSFMPGHGGFLDRFDSLLLAAPAVWLYVQLFLSKS